MKTCMYYYNIESKTTVMVTLSYLIHRMCICDISIRQVQANPIQIHVNYMTARELCFSVEHIPSVLN